MFSNISQKYSLSFQNVHINFLRVSKMFTHSKMFKRYLNIHVLSMFLYYQDVYTLPKHLRYVFQNVHAQKVLKSFQSAYTFVRIFKWSQDLKTITCFQNVHRFSNCSTRFENIHVFPKCLSVTKTFMYLHLSSQKLKQFNFVQRRLILFTDV